MLLILQLISCKNDTWLDVKPITQKSILDGVKRSWRNASQQFSEKEPIAQKADSVWRKADQQPIKSSSQNVDKI